MFEGFLMKKTSLLKAFRNHKRLTIIFPYLSNISRLDKTNILIQKVFLTAYI